MSAPNGAPPAAGQPPAGEDQLAITIAYLKSRGFEAVADQLTTDSAQDPAAATAGTGGTQVGLDEFAKQEAPPAVRSTSAGPQRRRPDQAMAANQMLADPPSWEKGYEGLNEFVENVSRRTGQGQLVSRLSGLFGCSRSTFTDLS